MSHSVIPILISFFENRRMSVKWRDVMYVTLRLKGGGPQGSTKGVLSYMSQSNDNTDCVPEDDRYSLPQINWPVGFWLLQA